MIAHSIIALVALGQQNAADDAEKMLRLMTADQPLVTVGTVDAPVNDVWKAWTTNDGIRSWMVASGEVELRIGGKYRTSYTPNSDLKGPDVIENTILAFDPGRMITIQNTRAPERFPFKEVLSKVWTVIYMEQIDEAKTQVVIRMVGFQHDEESQKCKDFFRTGNQATIDALVKKFQ